MAEKKMNMFNNVAITAPVRIMKAVVWRYPLHIIPRRTMCCVVKEFRGNSEKRYRLYNANCLRCKSLDKHLIIQCFYYYYLYIFYELNIRILPLRMNTIFNRTNPSGKYPVSN